MAPTMNQSPVSHTLPPEKTSEEAAPAPARPRSPLSYAEIKSKLDGMAYYLGEHRKVRATIEKMAELRLIVDNPELIHSQIASKPEEQDQDWRFALTYFATDVLSGRTDFVDQLDKESWLELEHVPLEDVKRLNAYHISLTDGRANDPAVCYREACEGLRAALLSPYMKYAARDFAPVRDFLKDRYSAGESFPKSSKGSDNAEALKRQTAEVLYQRRSQTQESKTATRDKDWGDACEYLSLFYGNVIGAVEAAPEERRKDHMTQALEAFRKPWRDYGLVNCLEAAIAIYFFDPKVVAQACHDKDDENDIL